MQTAYQLISVVGGVVTRLTLSDDRDALAASRDVMNAQAAPGVRYMVRLMQLTHGRWSFWRMTRRR
ncbi:MAG: hypothetical protein IPJ94_09495 [Chloroflexi bacterium]|nr:hypothetical protein [Chloroflexota bacterium]